MLKRNICIIFFLLESAILIAQNDHLEPVQSPFVTDIEYYQKIKDNLFKDLGNFIICQFVVIPSFSPEEVLQIERGSGDSFFLCYRKAKSQIWYGQNKKTKFFSYKKGISDSSVSLLTELFTKAIFQAKYTMDTSINLDGTSFYFSTWAMGQKSAMADNIGENKILVRQLIAICYEVIALCKDELNAYIDFSSDLKTRIKLLVKKFQ